MCSPFLQKRINMLTHLVFLSKPVQPCGRLFGFCLNELWSTGFNTTLSGSYYINLNNKWGARLFFLPVMVVISTVVNAHPYTQMLADVVSALASVGNMAALRSRRNMEAGQPVPSTWRVTHSAVLPLQWRARASKRAFPIMPDIKLTKTNVTPQLYFTQLPVAL